MKLKCVDVRESLVRGKIVRQASFVVLWPNAQTGDDPLPEVRIVDSTVDGIGRWKIGSEIEVT